MFHTVAGIRVSGIAAIRCARSYVGNGCLQFVRRTEDRREIEAEVDAFDPATLWLEPKMRPPGRAVVLSQSAMR
ncbi:hypothetical protein ABIG06_005216 [Bradyrhizobium sp. USDA 326]